MIVVTEDDFYTNCDDTPLSAWDAKQVALFRRFLQGERSHEIIAWATGDPQSSANDPEMIGMGL